MNREPLTLDRPLIRRRFNQAASQFDQASALDREVARRMAERLDYIRLQPKTILDLGCGTGADLNSLGERYPQAQRIACDFAPAMLKQAQGRTAWFKRLLPFGAERPQYLCADAERLPLAANSISLIWSNLMLHWLNDPLAAFRDMQRSLEVGGLLMFTTLGPDSLKELRQAFGEQPPRTHRFIDMHDIGDQLVAAGFSEPVMDMEMFTLTYPSSRELFAELRQSGSRNAAQSRQHSLTAPRRWQAAVQKLDAQRQQGQLPITIEVIYGHAWKSAPRTLPDGRQIVQFDPKRRG